MKTEMRTVDRQKHGDNGCPTFERNTVLGAELQFGINRGWASGDRAFASFDIYNFSISLWCGITLTLSKRGNRRGETGPETDSFGSERPKKNTSAKKKQIDPDHCEAFAFLF